MAFPTTKERMEMLRRQQQMNKKKKKVIIINPEDEIFKTVTSFGAFIFYFVYLTINFVQFPINLSSLETVFRWLVRFAFVIYVRAFTVVYGVSLLSLWDKGVSFERLKIYFALLFILVVYFISDLVYGIRW